MLSKNIKSDFPIFKTYLKLCYLDNAATTQKPKMVIDRICQFYEQENANIHRGIYELSEKATSLYEEARKTVADHFGTSKEEIIFVRNATEGINLVAYTFGETLKKGATILITELEHHSNIVPWQRLKERRNLKIEVVKIQPNGILDLRDLEKKIKLKPALLAITHISNVLGVINPLPEIIKKAHFYGTKVLVDASQSVPHFKVKVKELDADFLVFTGHKCLGPTGIGVLYLKKEIGENLPPFLTGGDMVEEVTFKKTRFLLPPQRFEAGTPHLAGAIGLKSALDYLNKIGLEKIRKHEKKLLTTCLTVLRSIKGVTIYGPADPKIQSGIVTFNVKGIHAHDLAQIFDQEKIAIRAGSHCAHPLMQRLGVAATARISFYLYNEEEDINRVEKAIFKAKKIFQ